MIGQPYTKEELKSIRREQAEIRKREKWAIKSLKNRKCKNRAVYANYTSIVQEIHDKKKGMVSVKPGDVLIYYPTRLTPPNVSSIFEEKEIFPSDNKKHDYLSRESSKGVYAEYLDMMFPGVF